MIFARSVFLLSLLLLGCDRGDSPIGPSDVVVADGEKHRGVNLVASSSLPADAFDHLLRNHVSWIAQVPFGWQRRYDDPGIELRTTSGVRWGETDAGLRATAAAARATGIRTLLKPHIWLIEDVPGQWRGTISFADEEQWRRWESDYRTFILHYARLAEEEGIEAFSIGVELRSAILARPEFWRLLISEVRAIYSGKVTYGANWYKEYREVPFWDQLDFIGIHAYFPLTAEPGASLTALERGWKPHLDEIELLQRGLGLPILFTEIGYRSIAGAAIAPADFTITASVDLDEQAEAYQALFRVFWDRPWFAGLYLWKWHPNHAPAGGLANDDYTPQNKPAERVLESWFGRETSSSLSEYEL